MLLAAFKMNENIVSKQKKKSLLFLDIAKHLIGKKSKPSLPRERESACPHFVWMIETLLRKHRPF